MAQIWGGGAEALLVRVGISFLDQEGFDLKKSPLVEGHGGR